MAAAFDLLVDRRHTFFRSTIMANEKTLSGKRVAIVATDGFEQGEVARAAEGVAGSGGDG